MRKIRNRRKDDAVSPVIATILMVAITVVLAAVLYVMVMGMTTTNTTITTPLALNQQGKTSSTVTIGITSAPNGATTDGVSISYTPKGGTPLGATATLYSAAGTVVANYTSTGFDDTTVSLTSGMTLVITPNLPSGTSVSPGDVISISTSQNTFGLSKLTVG